MWITCYFKMYCVLSAFKNCTFLNLHFMSIFFKDKKKKGTCIILNILFTLGKWSTAGCTKEGRQSVSTWLKKMILLCFYCPFRQEITKVMYIISFEASFTFFRHAHHIDMQMFAIQHQDQMQIDSWFVTRAAHWPGLRKYTRSVLLHNSL